ncbi:toxin-antitoxin system, antitoxin component, ArsR family [Leptospira licerasiae str. MMD4847]|uniref:Toxin-antitoxin system, antitoxin component, ArsR family n=2 Tax=Leptospira licerasiae TaxID=447106 RepID=A0ABP2RJ37_9LEPT|nr:toxin-antitoxin system, antitoxin component, ArsR family [Leptospira licerasiae str. MMD4847]
MALPSLMQHLSVLEDSSLVRSEKVGRVRTYKLTQDTMQAGEDWFVRQRTLWDRRLDQLDSYLLEMKEKENGKN